MLPFIRDASALALVKACACLAAVAAGFVAVSDDDFARVVISQRFAESPSLDPSGTSWLPAPFWLHGAAMWVAGRSFTSVRVVAAALGIAAVLFVHGAVRAAGMPRRSAWISAALVAWLPHSVWLGVATVPEMWTAALWVGALAASKAGPRWRLAGAAALAVATLSRYETWPVALVFSALCAHDARRGDRTAWAALALACAGPIAWLLHGSVRHGNALFFVDRVTAYRDALHGSRSLEERLLRYPIALVLGEPEVTVLAPLVCIAVRRQRPWRHAIRPLMGALAVFGFLVATDLVGGGPTHHPERPLLGVWFVGCLLLGPGLDGLWARRREPRIKGWILAACIALPAAALLRMHLPAAGFTARSAERAIGRVARTHAHLGERIAIDAPDFGFFAIMAAIGRPSDTVSLDEHDPRKAPALDPFRSVDTLRERLKAENARWLIAEARHAAVAHRIGAVAAHNEAFSLIRVSK